MPVISLNSPKSCLWKFEGTGSPATQTDSWGHANLSIYGNPGQMDPSWMTDPPGSFTASGMYGGTNDGWSHVDSSIFRIGTGDFLFVVVYYERGLTGDFNAIMSKANWDIDGNNWFNALTGGGGGNIMFRFGSSQYGTPGGVIPTGQWLMVVFERRGTALKVWAHNLSTNTFNETPKISATNSQSAGANGSVFMLGENEGFGKYGIQWEDSCNQYLDHVIWANGVSIPDSHQRFLYNEIYNKRSDGMYYIPGGAVLL